LFDLNIIGLHSFLELFLNAKKNVCEVIRSFNTVSLEDLQSINDNIDLLLLGVEIVVLVFDLKFPDFDIKLWGQSTWFFFISLSEIELSL
jgi:hypothetical protein